MPASVKIILLGDPEGIRVAARGFIDTKLMKFARLELGWHYRIRISDDFWIWRYGIGWCQVKDFHLGWGEVLLIQNVLIHKTNPFGPVNLAPFVTS